MKKLISAIILSLLIYSSVYAYNVQLFTNTSSIGAGERQWVGDKIVDDWVCDFDITGNPTAVTIRVEGNRGDMDNTVIDEGLVFDRTGMAEHEFTFDNLSSDKASFSIANSSVLYMRGFVVTLSGGSSPTVSGMCGGTPK